MTAVSKIDKTLDHQNVEALLLQARWLYRLAPDVDIDLANWLERQGIDYFDCENLIGPLRTHPVRFLQHGFDFVDRGPASVIQGVYNENGAALDLVAWSLTEPNKISLFFGDGVMLGANNAATPTLYPLQVHRSPLNWLRARCTGICILSATNARKTLGRHHGKLIAEDLNHAKALAKALAPAVGPERIVMPRLRLVGEVA